jgi:hypothetical protein
MRRPNRTRSALVFLALGARLFAQEPPHPLREGASPPGGEAQPVAGQPKRNPRLERLLPRFQKTAVSMRILARILSESDEEIWKTEYDKHTIPGRPVALRLVGTNIAVAVQFTPYLRPDNQWVLVAQGRLWLENSSKGLRYETTLQTIPVKLGEQVYYFPLGSNRPEGGDYIEISVELSPYTGDSEAEKPEKTDKQEKPDKIDKEAEAPQGEKR